MARPQKQGLDYFPFSVDLLDDEKLDRLRETYGTVINDVYISLLCLLYKNEGYYIPYKTPDEKQDCVWFIYKKTRGGKFPVKQEIISEMIEACVARGLFSRDHYPEIITSERAQTTFYSCTVDRKSVDIDLNKWVVPLETMGKISKKHPFYFYCLKYKSDEKPSKSDEKPRKSGEKPIKESKVNKSKDKERKEKFLSHGIIDDCASEGMDFDLLEQAYQKYPFLHNFTHLSQFKKHYEDVLSGKYAAWKTEQPENRNHFENERKYSKEELDELIDKPEDLNF